MTQEYEREREERELLRFQFFYNQRNIKATWILIIIIGIVFLLEEYFGGSENVNILVKMGANLADIKDDGYFRLFSSVFLHAGFLHVLFNIYALYALGGFFNRILGESRYLFIYFISGICGSLASLYLGKSHVSVGASGAIWGLFGASVVLSFFKSRYLPDAVRVRLRKITLINILINLGVSFLPMVDIWAHLGGGLGGLCASLLFIFEPKSAFFRRASDYFFGVSAGLLAALYAASLTYASVHHKPWQNELESALHPIELNNLPFSMSIPSGLSQKPDESHSQNGTTFIFGDLLQNRVAIELRFFQAAEIHDSVSENWLKKQRQELLTNPRFDAEIRKSADLREEPFGRLLFFQEKLKNNHNVFNYIIVRESYVIKLALITDKAINQALVNQVAYAILMSIKTKSSL